jgi:tetratricopeptide (TPR) repeat protein
VKTLCNAKTAKDVISEVKEHLERERRELLLYGLLENDLKLFFHARVVACLPLPSFTPDKVKSLELGLRGTPENVVHMLVWRVMGLRRLIKIKEETVALNWLNWGNEFATEATSTEWANVAGTMRLSECKLTSQKVLDVAFEIGESARAWMEKAELLECNTNEETLIENYYHRALLLRREDSIIWGGIGRQLAIRGKLIEAEAAFRSAIELSPMNATHWCNLATACIAQNKLTEALESSLEATKLDPHATEAWHILGVSHLISNNVEEAEFALKKAIDLDATNPFALANFANVLRHQGKAQEAIDAYQHVVSLDRKWLPMVKNNLNIGYAQLFTQKAMSELADNQLNVVKARLRNLMNDVSDLSSTFATEHFVEGFLTLALKQKHQATFVLDVLREMNADRFARPLLIAFEAAIEGKAANLDELEPELQRAAKLMYERLTAKPV